MPDIPGPGDHLGPYLLVRELGRGGMGMVFEAVDGTLDRRVALKVISPRLAGDPAFRARFTSEAQAQASLDSPYVVTVLAHGEADGCLYIATQLVPDGDLGVLLRRDGALPPRTAVDLIGQVASGLADAHAAGLVHRDVKPANVLLRVREEGVSAYLADFGIARRIDGGSGPAEAAAVGTPGFMAPELHAGGVPSPRSDVYSLGCLFWAALCGQAPYQVTGDQVAAAHRSAPVPQLHEAGRWEREANRVLRTALAKSPRDRHPTAAALRDDLRTLLRRPAPARVRAAEAGRSDRRTPRPTPAAAVAIAAALVVAAMVGILTITRGDDAQAGPRARSDDDAVAARIASALAAAGTIAPRDAECVATALVTSRGVDGLVDARILDEQHHVTDLASKHLDPAVLGDIFAIGRDCIL